MGVSYTVFLEREVHQDRDKLPGNVRQRVRALISGFAANPRPPGSEALDATGIAIPDGAEARRYRLEPWRIVYAVSDAGKWVWVLAVRRRPPYDYADLAELLARLPRPE